MLHHVKNLFYHLKGTGDPYHVSRILFIIKSAFAYYISSITGGAYLARLTSALGFSDSLTGLLSSFVSLSAFFMLASLFLMKKNGSMKWRIVLIVQLVYVLFTFIYVVPLFDMDAGLKRLIFVGGFMLAYILAGVVAPNVTDWLMSLVADDHRGRYTAANEIFSLLSGMVFTYALSALIDRYENAGDTRGALIVSAVAMAILTVGHGLAFVFIKEKPTVKTAAAGTETDAPKARRPLSEQFSFLRNKMAWKVIGVLLLWYVVTYCSTPFYGSYQIHELGFSMTFVSVLGILYGIIRSIFSPFIGRYADRYSFSRSYYLCIVIAAVSYLVNCFTVPENGTVMYTLYYCIFSVACAGIGSAQTNIVFDYIPRDQCRQVLAVACAFGGLAGFLSTCLMSPIVDYIQSNGNMLFGIHIYSGQFVSIVALFFCIVLFLYLHFFFIRKNPPLAGDKAK